LSAATRVVEHQQGGGFEQWPTLPERPVGGPGHRWALVHAASVPGRDHGVEVRPVAMAHMYEEAFGRVR